MRDVSKAVSEDGPPETTESCAVRVVHDGGNFGSVKLTVNVPFY